jgi:hypothetical protein
MPVRPNNPRFQDPLAGNFELVCTNAGCEGTLIANENLNCGWTLNMVVPMDESALHRGRCPRCKAHKMKVVKVPEAAPPPGPKGFTKIPTK